MRQRFWQGRAIDEYRRWPLTLFGTFTMTPQQHYMIDARINRRLHAKLTDRFQPDVALINGLTAHDLFLERTKEFGDELTKYVKRLRKGDEQNPPAQIRYLLIAEQHDGTRTSDEMRYRPHYHALIHDLHGRTLVKGSPLIAMANGEDGEWIRKRYKTAAGWQQGIFVKDDARVRTEWPMGFTKFQFAENEKAAGYLCKYLSKALDYRVRASIGYGSSEPVTSVASSANEVQRGRIDP